MVLPDLNRLSMFIAVAQAGGFTAAAERMGVAKSMVSQQVGQLELELGVTLFARTTRRVTLTESGEALLGLSEPLLQGLQDAVASMGSGAAELSGRLKLTAPADYAGQILAPVLAQFALQHPRVQLEILATDQQVDLVAEGVDLAIRMGTLSDSSLRATKLGQFEQVPVAAPGLLARVGVPNQPAMLAELPWLALTALRAPLSWRFTDPTGAETLVRLRAVLKANSTTILMEMARAGLGGAILPDYMVMGDLAIGRLCRLVPDQQLPAGGTYAVYPTTRQPPAKVRSLIDFLRQHMDAAGA
ncbi:LysR family transcriptional regulator [Chitinivorax sp. B]|uniref:LysR family transcriptional regulator n=1 Tax=Chitinivorax sp. B TaxID=2502235 RepID=UPI0010F68604|nr:LysR family transcriptional regulator [Chitinivorax sp. B]